VQKLIAVQPDLDAVVLLICDQPLVDAGVIAGLKAKHAETKKPIVASAYAETLGIAALFARAYFNELFLLNDELGAKQVILNHRADVAEYSFPEGAIDIDTAEDYEKLCRQR
jgi:molybdenum cofactor cytidylyltransferase